MVNQERSRDVLLAPIEHLRNLDIVQSDLFWKNIVGPVWQKLSSYGKLDMITLNFGEWETETSNDPNAIDCHAHAHIFLSLECVQNMTLPSKPQIGVCFTRNPCSQWNRHNRKVRKMSSTKYTHTACNIC